VGALFGGLAALCIGVSELFGRLVVRRRGPVAAALVVQGVALVVSVGTLLVVTGDPIGGELLVGLASGIGLGVGLWCYLGGLAVSSSAVVSPVVATLSAVVPFAYAVGRGAEASGWAIAGAIVAIGGLLTVATGGVPASNVGVGLRWGLVSGLGYGFGLAIVIETTAASGAWPAVAQRLAAFALMILLAIRTPPDRRQLGALRRAGIASGVFAGLSTIWYLLGVQADATPAVVTASMFPAASVIIGRFVFDDHVSRHQVLGLVLVLAGVAGVVAA
jgi:drug/metabolite transporter (DMT)-like permease